MIVLGGRLLGVTCTLGRGSGAPVELRSGIVYTPVDGQIVDQTIYATADEALEAVGLEALYWDSERAFADLGMAE